MQLYIAALSTATAQCVQWILTLGNNAFKLKEGDTKLRKFKLMYLPKDRVRNTWYNLNKANFGA